MAYLVPSHASLGMLQVVEVLVVCLALHLLPLHTAPGSKSACARSVHHCSSRPCLGAPARPLCAATPTALQSPHLHVLELLPHMLRQHGLPRVRLHVAHVQDARAVPLHIVHVPHSVAVAVCLPLQRLRLCGQRGLRLAVLREVLLCLHAPMGAGQLATLASDTTSRLHHSQARRVLRL